MTDVAPFRERPKFLLCPRCGEVLERAFEAVLTCLRCEGLWIATVLLEKAFGDPRWPRGPGMWWRATLECPECALEGEARTMLAVRSGDIAVDRCPSHGVWLDRTELFRLMGGDDPGPGGVSPDLAALRARLDAPDADLEQLARRRDEWRSDLGQRRRAAQEYRAWLEAEQRRRADAAQAIEREEHERRRAREQDLAAARAQEDQAQAGAQAEKAREAKVRADRARAEEELAELERARRLHREELARKRAEEERDRQRGIQRLGEARAVASAEVGRLETRIITLREQLRAAEAELDGARARLRVVDKQLELARMPPG
jgi:Zn-finger nucleic acid-binding protein